MIPKMLISGKVTVSYMADILGISEDSVRARCRDSDIPAKKDSSSM